MKTLPHIRKQEILDTLRQRGSIDVQELSKRFGVTYMTIHRDLQALEEEGLLSRVYGGAVAAAAPETPRKAEGPKPSPSAAGYVQAPEANRLIANAAAGQVRDGDIILMHELYQNSYEAFCIILDLLYEDGYEVVTVTELLGSSLRPGQKYTKA